MFGLEPPCLACGCDVGVPAPSCCLFPYAVQSHHGHLVPSAQTSPHCRHIVGLPSPQAGGCCFPGRQSCLPAAWGAPGLSALYSSSIHHLTLLHSTPLQAAPPEWGAKRCFSAQCYMVVCPAAGFLHPVCAGGCSAQRLGQEPG